MRMTLLIVGAAASLAAGGPIATDGSFVEWTPAHVIATDPSGDASGAFDVTSISAMGFDSTLLLRFDTGTVLNLPAGSGSDGTLRLELTLPSTTLTLDLRNRTAYTGGNPGNSVPWVDIGYESAQTYASSEFEAHVDLSIYGVSQGDTVMVNTSGSDSLASSGSVVMGPALPPDIRRSADRLAGTDFRVMSLNTLNDGLTHPTRGPGIQRIVDSLAADIYCFQEENASNATIANTLQSLDPFGDGASWNVIDNGDNVIASRSPVTEVAVGNTRYVAGLVELPAGAVFVLSVHPSCCGYIGNSNDINRINQTADMVDVIDDLRSGSLGAGLVPFADAPVIVIGDYNLVGSRTPLDMLEASPGPGLERWQIRHLIGNRVITWRNDSSSFWPGQLDLVAHSPDTLIRRSGFVFDTDELNTGELTAMGVQSGDSDGSDHLTLVTDFAFGVPCAADLAPPFGTLDFFDVLEFLSQFDEEDPAADLAPPFCTFDFFDTLEYLSLFSDGC